MSIIEKLEIHKGPYSVEHVDFDEHRILAKSENPEYRGICSIAEVYRHENALMFAAAPEMLEALIDNVLMIEAIPHYLELDSWEYNNRIQSIDIIEKATGKTWAEIKELL